MRTCHVSDDGCTAPAGFQVGGMGGPMGENSSTHTRGTCFACGEPVCTACSRRRRWHTYGTRRICAHCDGFDLTANMNLTEAGTDEAARRADRMLTAYMGMTEPMPTRDELVDLIAAGLRATGRAHTARRPA